MEDLKTWIVKILLPSLVAVSIKLAVQSKRETISWFSVISSFVIGVGAAYISSDWVMETFDHKYVSIAIAFIAISGEQIGVWCVYTFKVESILEGVLERWKKK